MRLHRRYWDGHHPWRTTGNFFGQRMDIDNRVSQFFGGLAHDLCNDIHMLWFNRWQKVGDDPNEFFLINLGTSFLHLKQGVGQASSIKSSSSF